MCENGGSVKRNGVKPLLSAPLTPAEFSPDGWRHHTGLGICWSPTASIAVTGCHILSAGLQGQFRPQTRRNRLRRLSRVLLSLCSTRYVWRKHPRLRMAEFNFISLYWPSLPNGIQAAYEDFDRDLIFIFKGDCPRFSSSSCSRWREGQDSFVLFSRFKEVSQGESVNAGCVFVERPGLGPLSTTNRGVNLSRLYPLQALISSFTKWEHFIRPPLAFLQPYPRYNSLRFPQGSS